MIKLNCDLGEGYGAWKMPHDQFIMPYIDMANIACGFHAGDPLVIQKTLQWAIESNVSIGAHPSYPDRQGFGRRSMQIEATELTALIHYQVSALNGMAQIQGASVDYVKPHGALYNDMMVNPIIFETLVKAVSGFETNLPIVIQATPDWQKFASIADKYQVPVWYEAFADRSYRDDGKLVSRQEPHAVLSASQQLLQVENLVSKGQVTTESGNTLALKFDTICVHGDSQNAVDTIKHLCQTLSFI